MQPGVNASIIEQQRRIHELESRAEEAREHTTHAAIPVSAPAPVQEVQAYEPAPAAKVEEPRVEAPRRPEPRVEEPRIDAQQLLSDSGLVMIETDRAKVQIQPPVVEEAQPVGRPRRERAKPVSQDEELVQVETRK